MKKCSKCGEEKPLSGFHKDKSKQDGYTYQCKDCRRGNLQRWRKSPEGNAKYNANQRRRYAENPARQRERRYAIVRKKPWLRNAHNAVNKAVRKGALPPAKDVPCELVGPDCHGAHQWHHDDYNKPLEVRCLCASHHKLWHLENTPKTPTEQLAVCGEYP
jgi:hypothetical protein